ncbi:MAG: plasmid maintenance system killer family protein [Bacteroidetes bacterium GWF2_49_14]|nr:MAG: plasmid maintenance system killer family protein [Bacteroidetes bacterium GWF2_49_14]HBB92980.1 plasmid maintenance system killer family protein [Bacteroidales bacterium]
MIISFGSKAAENIWNGNMSLKIPVEIQQVARRKLRMLNNAQTLHDLKVPPSNHLEKLAGNLKGYHSIRVNDQWRIIFRWKASQVTDVEIVDYHK